jgi:hypothetical protein
MLTEALPTGQGESLILNLPVELRQYIGGLAQASGI